MKTRTLKTAGAAALGIAFAVAAAGPAAAAGVGGATDALGGLPLDKATKHLPGAAQSTETTKTALGSATSMVPATTARALPGGLPGGGLPTEKLTGGGLPTSGLPTSAVAGALPTGAVPGGLLGG